MIQALRRAPSAPLIWNSPQLLTKVARIFLTEGLLSQGYEPQMSTIGPEAVMSMFPHMPSASNSPAPKPAPITQILATANGDESGLMVVLSLGVSPLGPRVWADAGLEIHWQRWKPHSWPPAASQATLRTWGLRLSPTEAISRWVV